MSGRGITTGGRKALFSVGVPFMSFMVLGSYGLSEWVGAKMRIKEEKKQQVFAPPPLPCTAWLLACRALTLPSPWADTAGENLGRDPRPREALE